ncbi:PaaI family thioesterase [Chelativorans sp. YIM 93263]|uniref:PaaI family thioesterase n=1 Tax=Chelativorans sp. YIM 93263 TaxID=2906648 RepID=UPI002378D805|nr:PaaI family thioesterase [Chelativorans sp. YIM 93263]
MNVRAGRELQPVLSVEEVNAYLAEVYPQLNDDRSDYCAVAVRPGGCTVRLEAGERHLRPGNTVSGPSLFTLADIGGYVCALSHVGREALAVTTNLNINFMRKAQAGRVDGACRILKLGRSLMVFDVAITAGPDEVLVAHATGTYSLPPAPAGVVK